MGAVDDAKAAKTEALFREVNERVAERATDFGSENAEFVCECSDPTCTRRIHASLTDYEDVRSEGDLFLVARGHEDDRDRERVVAHIDGFEIVRKLRELGAIVRRLDPRAEGAQ